MKKIYNSKNAGKLAAYSAMAGAFVAVASDANAAIIYTDIEDTEFGTGESFQLDMNDDGTVDFLMVGASNTAGTWTFAYVIGNLSAYGYGGPDNMFIGYDGVYLPYGSALAAGDEIGPDGSFLSNTINYGVLASIFGGVTYGAFANTTDAYLGVQFDIDGSLHYGWVRLDVSVGPISVTVKDFAYEDVATEPINAGDVDVAVNNLTEAQVSTYSYGNTINVIVKDAQAGIENVRVFDVNGKAVYTNRVTNNNMAITLDNVATGMYTIQLTGTTGSYNKQMYIQN